MDGTKDSWVLKHKFSHCTPPPPSPPPKKTSCVELRVLNEGLKQVCWFGVQGSLVRSRGVSASTTIGLRV